MRIFHLMDATKEKKKKVLLTSKTLPRCWSQKKRDFFWDLSTNSSFSISVNWALVQSKIISVTTPPLGQSHFVFILLMFSYAFLRFWERKKKKESLFCSVILSNCTWRMLKVSVEWEQIPLLITWTSTRPLSKLPLGSVVMKRYSSKLSPPTFNLICWYFERWI